ncbi:MAG: hypothetical protein ACRC7C_16180 [Beijerinckiaceae bacterium]
MTAGKRFIAAFAALACGCALLLLVLLLAFDPFATGRFAPVSDPVPAATAPRMANASRIRHSPFDAAIVGNSTIQLLSPQRLQALTGQTVVQLSIPGTGPVEQKAVVDRLLADRGTTLKTLVLGLDSQWCSTADDFKPLNPFPFWLYGESNRAFAAGLFRFDSVEALPRRILGAGPRTAEYRPDGFWDFERLRDGPQRAGEQQLEGADVTHKPSQSHAALGVLNAIIDRIPPGVRLIVLHPPVYLSPEGAVSRPGYEALARCKAQVADALKRFSGGVVVDALVPDTTTTTRSNFYDQNHYVGRVAFELEQRLADIMLSDR